MAKLDLVALAPDVVYILILGVLIRALFGKMSQLDEKTTANNTNLLLFKQETHAKLTSLETDVTYIKKKMDGEHE